MDLNNITTKPYILALFKRDDGLRFLLGSGAYEFKDSQKHFVANTMVNDVVEVQGSDGALLAGQVRRASTQAFDGFVGDASSTKQAVENYRRDFVSFFQKNHFYTVVYIFADGTAIQRKRGYIVDSPQVQELYQMYPEYHIALNFEDVNYYKYSEDDSGNESYSNYVDVISLIKSSGGLIWAEGGEGAGGEGTEFSIYGTESGTDIKDAVLKGQTSQTTYSGKNLVYTKAGIDGGITFAYDSATGTTTITGQQSYGFALSQQVATNLPAGTYTVSIDAPQEIIIGVGIYDGSDNRTAEEIAVGQTSLTFTALAPIAKFETIVAGLDSGTTYNLSFKLQLESGSTATTFEPYVGGVASPNPDFPQNVNVVAGTQTVTVSDGNSQSQTYTIDLGSIELCKIGNYQDYIYKSGNDWYVHKETGFVTLDPNKIQSAYDSKYRYAKSDIPNSDIPLNSSNFLCKYFTVVNNSTGAIGTVYAGGSMINFRYDEDGSDYAGFKTWASSVGLSLYYVLATATDTQITDATLISDLDSFMQNAECYDTVTKFKVEGTGTNLPAWLQVELDIPEGGVVWDNIGAVWEEGGEGGETIVTVDSITSVFPTITITGPAYNPQIENITTGQVIKYNGNVVMGQTLVIDILQKTAKLNGTSVIGSISGDWLYLNPGNNRIVYSIDNVEPNTAIIEWQEIVG